MPTVDSRDLEEKGRLLAEADRDLVAVTEVADALTGALLSTADGSATDRATRMAALADQVSAAFDRVATGYTSDGGLGQRALYWLDEGRPPMAPARVPLHWPLAFPEVYGASKGRFDAAVSNPPFLGGSKITGALGDSYRAHIVEQVASGVRGNADLVAYFFLRAAAIASATGCVATNTIGQGDTSEVGLRSLVDRGSSIYRALSSVAWPGAASLEVALVWMCSRPSGETANLDGVTVESIDETLHRASPSGWRRRSLASSATKSFVGSKIYGQGFLLTPAHARSLIDTDARYSEVVFPYMGGEDLNQSPTLTAPRWVINFFDWPLERAQGFDQCFEQVKDLVKPSARRTAKARRERWWGGDALLAFTTPSPTSTGR